MDILIITLLVTLIGFSYYQFIKKQDPNKDKSNILQEENTSLKVKISAKDQEIILVCGAGGMAALTGKTMMEMGYTNIKNEYCN